MTKRNKRYWSILLVVVMLFSVISQGAFFVTAEDETLLPEGAIETGDGYFIYQAESYYNGNISENAAADMQPGETIEIALNSNVDFVAGKYTLTVSSCGNRESFEILINGEHVGTISRVGTGFGMDQMTSNTMDAVLELKPDDVVTIVAPDGGYYGWVDYLRLDVYTGPVINEDYFIYQAEAHYDGNISEGTAADLQPGEAIEVALNSNADFVAGKYMLTISSCGNRESFDILINGESVGTISRTGTGFGMNEMTNDILEVVLELKPEDVITIVAPSGSYWGWVDYLRLDVYSGPEVDEDYFIYQVEDYYNGNISENAAADMQPGETIEIALNSNADFAAGKYTLTVSSCGNRESFEILVNGESVGTISRTGTDFGMDQMTSDTLAEKVLELNSEDVVAIVAPADGYGWVDYLRLDAYSESGDEEQDPVDPPEPTLPDAATETGDGYFVYQMEYFYNGNISENIAADMQPGETIEIALNSNADFAAGKYTLTVSSCGNRESFEILVNGESVGTISRTGTDFGMDQMTSDTLAEKVLELNSEDVVSIVAPADGYGWVDYLRLDAYSESGDEEQDPVDPPEPTLPDAATESGDGYFVYQMEYFYNGNISENIAADMQPGEAIEVKLNANKDFAAGTYTLTISSCGNRESFEILVNGESVGTISRTGTGFGVDQMTCDKMLTTVELDPDDTLSIVAQSGEFWGWVDYIVLDVGDITDEPNPEPGDSDTGNEPITETGDGYFIYQAESYYNGNISEGAAADLQPGEMIHFKLDDNKDFTAGTYTLSIRSCGNREKFYVLVNNQQVGTVERAGTEFGMDQMTYNKMQATLKLKPGDTLSIVAQNGEFWGWVDFIALDVGDTTEAAQQKPAQSATETGDGYFIYQAEGYYNGNISEGVAADLQPGERINFKLGDNKDFTAGTYTLSIRSCGNRERFTVLVNNQQVGTVERVGTEFGMDQMTYDKLLTTLELKPGDTLSIVAQNGGFWGWVDFIVLDVGDTTGNDSQTPEGEPTQVGDGFFVYQTEFFYHKLAEGIAADLQPGTVIDIPLNACSSFTDGWYTITVASCGSRESIYLRINDKVIGSVSRFATDYGVDAMTENRYSVKVHLSYEDVLTLSAPNDDTFGWVDYVRLDAVDPPAGANTDDTITSTEPADKTTPVDEPNNVLPVIVAVIAAVIAIIIVAALFILIRRKNGK